jgi:hypothetical protein
MQLREWQRIGCLITESSSARTLTAVSILFLRVYSEGINDVHRNLSNCSISIPPNYKVEVVGGRQVQ